MNKTSASSGSRFYRPELDVLRFIAFLMVFATHALPRYYGQSSGPFQNAFSALVISSSFGLDLFFALSAFLICELLMREREATGDISVKLFYIRRTLRIWPLYYLGLVISTIFVIIKGHQPAGAAYVVWSALFLGSWFRALHPTVWVPMAHLWSISIEEQFYMFAPWIVKFLTRKSLYVFCATLVAVANLWIGLSKPLGEQYMSLWFNAFVQFESFAAGIFVCLALHGREPNMSLRWRVILTLNSFAFWFATVYVFHNGIAGSNSGLLNWRYLIGYALVASAASGLLIAFLGTDPKRYPSSAIYLGRISYGLYVFHYPALEVVRRLLPAMIHFRSINSMLLATSLPGLVLTMIMASVSYRFFETPFLRLKKRFTIVESRPISTVGLDRSAERLSPGSGQP